MKRLLLFIPFILFLVLAGLFLRGLFLEPQKIPSVQVGRQLPDFKLPNLEAKNKWFTNYTFRHHVILLNVWASWCDVCRDEQVVLLNLAKSGVPIYGLNYKDNSEDARAFLKTWGNPFLAVGEDLQGKLAIDLGVYGAPETFVIDQDGVILYRHVGVLTMDIWKNTLLPLFNKDPK